MEKIYTQNAKLVFDFLLSKCKDANVAEELTQETFLQAIKSFDSYNGTCKISVWLCQIAKHLLYQYWSKHKDTVSLSNVDWEIPNNVDLEKLVMDRMEIEHIRNEINKLPENMRKVLFFRVSQNMSFKEIGEMMERSENWARVTCVVSPANSRKNCSMKGKILNILLTITLLITIMAPITGVMIHKLASTLFCDCNLLCKRHFGNAFP